MQKKIIILFSIIAVIIISFLYFYNNFHNKEDISKISDAEIVSILNKNQDVKEYIEKNKDFSISKKEILTKEAIVAGQNGENFKEVDQGLELQDNRYIKIDLINKTGDKGFVAVIDFKEKTVPKAFGIILIKVGTPRVTKCEFWLFN